MSSRVLLEPPSPALMSLHHRVVVADHDEPSAGISLI
jgi:hypothetical protein